MVLARPVTGPYRHLHDSVRFVFKAGAKAIEWAVRVAEERPGADEERSRQREQQDEQQCENDPGHCRVPRMVHTTIL